LPEIGGFFKPIVHLSAMKENLMAEMTVPVPSFRVRRNTLFLGLLAALFIAGYKAMDNMTVHKLILANDSLTQAFSYLFIGGWTGVVCTTIYALLFGKKIDPAFAGIVFTNRRLHLRAAVAGSMAAVATLFTLMAHQFSDPSGMVALATAVMAMTAMYDVFTGQVSFRAIIGPAIATLLGASLAAYSGSFAVTAKTLLYVLVIANTASLLSEIFGQKGSRVSDGVNLFLWRFIWLAGMGTIFGFVGSALRGQMDELLDTIQHSIKYVPVIAVTMLFVFIGEAIKETLKKNNPLSVVLMITAFQVVLAFPLTLIGNQLWAGVFGDIPSEPGIWGVRMIGAGLLIWSIYQIRHVQSEAPAE
jgi:hypothetical protein